MPVTGTNHGGTLEVKVGGDNIRLRSVKAQDKYRIRTEEAAV